MKIKQTKTETYILTELDRLDPVTVYVTNFEPGKGKIVIECYNQAWQSYWGGMSGMRLEDFFLTCNNDYLLGYFLNGSTRQTDFDAINERMVKKNICDDLYGYPVVVTSDVEIAMNMDAMREAFGGDWMVDLPTCKTREYEYLGRILSAVKAAFQELQQERAA